MISLLFDHRCGDSCVRLFIVAVLTVNDSFLDFSDCESVWIGDLIRRRVVSSLRYGFCCGFSTATAGHQAKVNGTGLHGLGLLSHRRLMFTPKCYQYVHSFRMSHRCLEQLLNFAVGRQYLS